MSQILYQADNLNIVGEIKENVSVSNENGTITKNVDSTYLKLNLSILINGKMKVAVMQFPIVNGELQNYNEWYTLHYFLSQIGYEIGNEGNAIPENIINKWLFELIHTSN